MSVLFLVNIYLLPVILLSVGYNNFSENNLSNYMKQKVKDESKWEALFDGKTTTGWHTYGNESIGKAWIVTNGMLSLNSSVKKEWQPDNGGDIVTNSEYENFHLKLEWKISKGGNSGIIFYVQEDTSKFKYSWESGPEMQVLDNDLHSDGKIEKHRAGDLYDLISISTQAVKPAGEWNKIEIIADKGKLDFYINAEHVLLTTLWDDNWNNLIAGSKFKNISGFGTFRKGKICLQDHGNDVWFRNIMIKKL